MFYATQIKSVGKGVAVDTRGNTLTFIGYLPVQAGDTVYTDGKIIFGNAPPKGSPAVFDEPGGIPVLGADELRGYFTLNGKYKKFGIKGNEWIVNNDKNYKHDDGEENIIDAEIATDGSVYTVEKKVTQLDDNDEDCYFYYYHREIDRLLNPEHYFYSIRDRDPASMFNDNLHDYQKYTYPLWIPLEQADFANRDELYLKQCNLIIKKNKMITESVDIYNKICGLVKKETQKYINVEVNNDIVLQRWNWPSRPDGASLFAEYVENFKIRGTLLNFKILSNAKWTALVWVEIWAERGFPMAYKGKVSEVEGTAATHMLFGYKINSEGGTEEIFRVGIFMPLLCYATTYCTAVESTYSEYQKLLADAKSEQESTRKSFPTVWFDDNSIIYASNPAYDRVTLFFEWIVGWDSRNLPDAPNYDKPTIEFVDDFYFPVQDDYQAKIKNLGADIDSWQLSGVLDGKNHQVIGEILPDATNAHKWNMSLAQLKGGGYLFGIHDGDLFKVDKNGNSELVGTGLKNFRLRELKRISKSRK